MQAKFLLWTIESRLKLRRPKEVKLVKEQKYQYNTHDFMKNKLYLLGNKKGFNYNLQGGEKWKLKKKKYSVRA